MNNLTIGFRNRNQVVLFTNELQGQISDGKWENSTPRRHYELPCEATAFVATDDSQLGRNFPARSYNFADIELVEIVGDRMINMVKLSQAFPTVPIDELPDMESTARKEIEAWVNYSNGSSTVYWMDKINKTCLTFGVENVEQLIVKLETAMNGIVYTLTDLRRDLNDMKKCWKIVR